MRDPCSDVPFPFIFSLSFAGRTLTKHMLGTLSVKAESMDRFTDRCLVLREKEMSKMEGEKSKKSTNARSCIGRFLQQN